MRVAITGAHGVGKSTLAAAISHELEVPELPTPGRTLAGLGLPVNQRASVASQAVAWLMQYRFERELSAWVSSRSLLDVWAYTVLAGERGVSGPIEAALLSELERSTQAAIVGAYDVLVYVPPAIPLIADDIRDVDKVFQSAVDARISKSIARWEVAHDTVDVSNPGAVAILLERLVALAHV
jgi:hypothetical protein